MYNRLLLLSLWGFVLLMVGRYSVAESLAEFNLPPALGREYHDKQYTGRWYATSDSGTYMVSGQRVVMFDGVQLPEEAATRLMNLLVGVVWKEGSLLSHEMLLNVLWPHLPWQVKLVLRGTSQAWLLYTLYRSVLDVSAPLLTLINDYRRAWSEPRYIGALPIAVNDAELSFRIFLQAQFPEKMTDPVAVSIDQIPDMSELPALVRPHGHLNPWTRLLKEMSASDIHRLQLAGSAEGGLELRFRDRNQGWREQTISTPLNGAYQPVPWLLEMVRQKIPRDNVRLYASLLSQDVIDLVGSMLNCRRLEEERPGESLCPGGRLMNRDGGLEYIAHEPVVPPQIWDSRNYEQGRVLPLTGCNFNGQSLCWENYLIWGNGSVMYPWPVLTLYTRFASFKERNSWLLLDMEPQTWDIGSYFQVRVPELVTRAALATLSSVAQVVANRMVTSLHHYQWRNDALEVVGDADAEETNSEAAPSGHANVEESTCKACGGGECKYPACLSALCGRYKPETVVNLGCSKGGVKHQLCISCFRGQLRSSALKACPSCKGYHHSMIHQDYYQIDPEEAHKETASVPKCPMCRVPFDSRKGNVSEYLRAECGALGRHLRWLFSDSLEVDDPVKSKAPAKE